MNMIDLNKMQHDESEADSLKAGAIQIRERVDDDYINSNSNIVKIQSRRENLRKWSIWSISLALVFTCGYLLYAVCSN